MFDGKMSSTTPPIVQPTPAREVGDEADAGDEADDVGKPSISTKESYPGMIAASPLSLSPDVSRTERRRRRVPIIPPDDDDPPRPTACGVGPERYCIWIEPLSSWVVRPRGLIATVLGM
jgi:hypothetical protein